jgi:ectoine hydroxylase-related dioxygenase (phytanoyl-CoA dioxygenase family)
MIAPEQKAEFERDGYTVVRGLFSEAEVEAYREHYMALRAAGTYWGDFAGVDLTSSDPLKRYPRMIHMHRWDKTTLEFLINSRINECLTALLGAEPYAVQTMLYFKPPGARGQALHQDQSYLRVQPGTCAAAWLALDRCDEENGCMQLVPGTNDLPLLCTEKADTSKSFTDVTVPLAEGMHAVPMIMNAGDVLFFNGQVIHGSLPNVSKDRFRRSLIGHYIVGEAEKVGGFYHPVLRMDGTEVDLGLSEGGGPCGVWREVDGSTGVEMILPDEPEPVLHE